MIVSYSYIDTSTENDLPLTYTSPLTCAFHIKFHQLSNLEMFLYLQPVYLSQGPGPGGAPPTQYPIGQGPPGG